MKGGLLSSFLAALALTAVLLGGCGTVEHHRFAVTEKVFDELTESNILDNFRFVISKDIVLTRVDNLVGTDMRRTVVKRDITTNFIYLNAITGGRVQAESSRERLLIAFEKESGGSLPLAFVQKTYAHDTDLYLYYFEYNDRGHIEYNGGEYDISYEDPEEEPHLLYLEETRRKVNERTMKGID
jgi:hypothetical protein